MEPTWIPEGHSFGGTRGDFNGKGFLDFDCRHQQASPSTHTTHHTRKANSTMSVTPLGTLAGLPWLDTGNREGRRMASRRCHKQYVFYNSGDYFGFMANYVFHKSNNQPHEGARSMATNRRLLGATIQTLPSTQQATNTHCTRMGTEPPHDSESATMWSTKLPM